jgi:general secretion pathway protein L
MPKLRLALPNLVEDRLVQDAQQCHIALGPRLSAAPVRGWRAPREPQSRTLMIADRAWVRFILDNFGAHKHRTCHLLPAQLCLPFETPASVAPSTEAANDAERAEPSLEAPVEPVAAETADAAAAVVAPATIALDAAPPSDPDAPAAVDITVRTGPAEGYGLRLLPANVANWLAIAPTPARLMESTAIPSMPST